MGTEFRYIGAPGAGKSTSLMERIRERYLRLGLGPRDAVVSSLTHTASNNLIQRNTLVDKAQVGTLHSLCLKSIMNAESSRFGVADNKSGIEAWNIRVKTHNLNPDWYIQYHYESDDDRRLGLSTTETGGGALLNRINILRASCQPADTWPTEAVDFYREWAQYKSEHNLLDYTDMIAYCLAAHLPPPGNARVGFFDEVQDFTALEMRLIRMWGREYFDEYYLAGDDDQCLYGFAGADPRAFIDDIEGVIVERTVLSKSWRLPAHIASAAEAQLVNLQYRQPKSIIPVRDGGDIVGNSATWVDPTPLRKEIDLALAGRKSIMLLTTCQYMLKPAIAWLYTLGIPFHNPWRRVAAWNPLQPTDAVSASQRLDRFLAGPNAWTAADVQLWTRDMRCDGKHALQRGAEGRIRGYQDDGRPLTFLMNDWFTPDACRQLLGPPDAEWFMGQLRDSAKEKYRYPLAAYRSQGQEALASSPYVMLGTVHSVKGGEADVVVLFPSLSPRAQAERRTADGRDAVDRMMYVGMTRARERLVVASPTDAASTYRFKGDIFTR